MYIFKLLQKRSKRFIVFLILLGMVNSTWSGLLLMIINNAISGNTVSYLKGLDWLAFSVLIVVSFFASKYFQAYMIEMTNDLSYQAGMSIFNSLRFATYDGFRKIGNQRVYTSIADSYTVSNFPQHFIEIFNSAIIMLIVVIYFFFISVVGGLFVLGVISALATIFMTRNKHISKSLNKLRDLSDTYHQNINDLLNGFKEVKMSRKKNDLIYHEYVDTNRKLVKDLSIKTSKQYFSNELSGTYSWYVIIGLIIFAMPLFVQIDVKHLANYIVSILFLLTPLNSMISMFPHFTKLNIALKRLRLFQQELSAEKMLAIGHGQEDFDPAAFSSIELVDIEYEYIDERNNERFTLGPINMLIRKGEMLFITGGNGSGKSTLLNLLAGLTGPSAGKILMDGVEVNEFNVQAYRECVAAIFTDNYLFKHNYAGYDFKHDREKLEYLIGLMKLKGIVRVDEQQEFIFTDLSKGQQKRLAMVHALMDERPILVLDEWAAEQDPSFRYFFYNEFLDILKQMNKTIILVTHDDRYFSKTNRMVKLNFGKIIEETQYAEEPLV